MNDSRRPWIVWGSELSPFTLKLIRLHRHAQVPIRFLPAHGRWLENLGYALRVERLKSGRLPLTWPVMSADDEYPLVPFVFGPDGENLYDSTAIAHWLDRSAPASKRVIPADEAAAFVVRLIDDYADEFGLYLVHHNRWKVSALDNDAGARVAREFRFASGPLQGLFARRFAARQTRRLPYLFSVAPAGFHVDGLARERQPPARPGFPPTHALLEDAFARLLRILETLLTTRPHLLGTRFTLADAALYGQLGMNLSDPSADRLMRAQAPALHRWLTALHSAEPEPIASSGEARLDDAIKPLLAEIFRTHVPLMRQNAHACERARAAGARHFNEHAFNRGEALYDGIIDVHSFRSVAKTFQAKLWRDCREHWQQLSPESRRRVQSLLPGGADAASLA
jgi:glutathione S-transferase